MAKSHLGDPAWTSADGDPEGYGDPVYPPAVVYGLNWYEAIDTKEVKEMATVTTPTIPAGELVLVEVHGLPDENSTRAFTYRATYDLYPGQQVQVPAPEWSIRVTGRADLPGFVLGVSDEKNVPGLRDIFPEPAYPANSGVKELLTRWENETRDLEKEADELDREANRLYERVYERRAQISQVQHAAGV